MRVDGVMRRFAARGGFGGRGVPREILVCEPPAHGLLLQNQWRSGAGPRGPTCEASECARVQNTRPSPWRQLQSSAMPARRDKQRSCSRSDANMLTKYRRCYKRLRGARFLQYTRTMLDDRGGGRSRKWLPGARRDTQTDVSRTSRGVWYVITGQETKFGRWRRGPCAGPRVTTTTPTPSPHYESSTRFI